MRPFYFHVSFQYVLKHIRHNLSAVFIGCRLESHNSNVVLRRKRSLVLMCSECDTVMVCSCSTLCSKAEHLSFNKEFSFFTSSTLVRSSNIALFTCISKHSNCLFMFFLISSMTQENCLVSESVTSHDSLSLAESYESYAFHALHLVSRPLFYDSRLYKVVTYQMKLGKPRCRHKYTNSDKIRHTHSNIFSRYWTIGKNQLHSRHIEKSVFHVPARTQWRQLGHTSYCKLFLHALG